MTTRIEKITEVLDKNKAEAIEVFDLREKNYTSELGEDENLRFLEGYCSDSTVEACKMTAWTVRSLWYPLQLSQSNRL